LAEGNWLARTDQLFQGLGGVQGRELARGRKWGCNNKPGIGGKKDEVLVVWSRLKGGGQKEGTFREEKLKPGRVNREMTKKKIMVVVRRIQWETRERLKCEERTREKTGCGMGYAGR